MTQVHWGVTIPMTCQLCQRPVLRWEADWTSGCPLVRTPHLLTVMAICHGTWEVRMYVVPFGDVVRGLHPAKAFPMPEPTTCEQTAAQEPPTPSP